MHIPPDVEQNGREKIENKRFSKLFEIQVVQYILMPETENWSISSECCLLCPVHVGIISALSRFGIVSVAISPENQLQPLAKR